MMVFYTRYGFMRWSAYFALSFWRLRLKFNRFGAYLVGNDKGYVPIDKNKTYQQSKKEITMKTNRNVLFAILSIVLVIALVGCSSTTNTPDVEGAEFEEELLTFEELVLRSNVAVVGEYVETIKHDNYIEQKFKVKECLYGERQRNKPLLFLNIQFSLTNSSRYSIHNALDSTVSIFSANTVSRL